MDHGPYHRSGAPPWPQSWAGVAADLEAPGLDSSLCTELNWQR